MNWKITWWDGCFLRETIIWSSAWDVVSNASASGVITQMIFKIERIPE
jgi:hypothetical protein